MGHHLPFALWQPFRFGQRPASSVLAAWQGSCLHPRGSCYLRPAKGRRRDPDNLGKNEQMALLSRGLGWQLPSPPLLPEARAGCRAGSS